MLSARSEDVDRLLGLELGADDYVTKPFSPRELTLRVKSILRRGKNESMLLCAGEIVMHLGSRQCKLGGKIVQLTPKEFDLLAELLRAQGNVLTRKYLLERIWGYHGDATSRTLDTHMKRLREKLGPEAARLETVRGIGFRAGV